MRFEIAKSFLYGPRRYYTGDLFLFENKLEPIVSIQVGYNKFYCQKHIKIKSKYFERLLVVGFND